MQQQTSPRPRRGSVFLFSAGLAATFAAGCAGGGSSGGGGSGGTGTPGTGGRGTVGTGGGFVNTGTGGGFVNPGTGGRIVLPGTGGNINTPGTGGSNVGPGTGGNVGPGSGGSGAPGTGGGSVGAGGARACAPSDVNVISDFEEGFGVMVKQGSRTGFWYTYSDTCPTPPPNSYTCVGGGASSQTPPPAPATRADQIAVAPSGSTDMCNKFAFHSTASGHSAFVGFGAAFSPPAPPSTSMLKATYDVSAYDGISFTMRGGSGTQPPVLFELLTKENQPDKTGGGIPTAADGSGSVAHTATDLFNTRGIVLNRMQSQVGWQPALSATSQTYYVPFGMLIPRWVPGVGSAKACPLNPAAGDPKCQAPGWVPTSALGFQLSVLPDIPGSTGAYDLWVDDVKFYKRPATGAAPDLPAPPSGGGSHPFPQNASVGANCRKPVGPSVDGKFLVAAYNQWKATFVTNGSPGLKVIRPELANDTVSEGIAYGMIIAVYMNDKALFDGLWQYWKANAATSDGPLMTWRIGGGGGTGTATDADEDAAFAMLEASKQWTGSPTGDSATYAANAQNLMHAVLAHDMSTSAPFILGGSEYKTQAGLTGTTNPSYFAPAWYRVFATNDATMGASWTTLANNAYTMLAANTSGAAKGLFAAWCGNGCTVAVSNSGSQNSSTDTDYQYDAHRIPFRIGLDYCWNGGAAASGILAKNAAFFAGLAATGIGRVLDMYTPAGNDVAMSAPNSASILGTAAVGAMATTNATFVNDAYQAVFDMANRGTLAPVDTMGRTPYSYYNATVGMLTLLAMTGNLTPF